MESAGVLHRLPQRDNEEEEKMNLYFRVVKVVVMEVRKSDTIRNVKALLNDKEGISECLQEIFLTSDRLQDDNRLVDYGIQQNSTLNVFVQNSVLVRLNIKIPSHKKIIVVEAKTYDSIQNVKSLIGAREGVQSDSYHLVYAGKPLEDDKTLVSLGIHGEPTLYMVFNPKDLVPISVKMPSGEILEIEANIMHTICDVKTIVESRVGFTIDDLCLTYKGRQLEDSKTLYYYNIQEKSTLNMSTQTIQVFIRDVQGVTQIIDVCRKDSVKDVKDMIFHKLGIPAHAQRLVFDGKSLDDDRNLASYNVQKDSTLNVVLWTPSFVQRKKLSELGIYKRQLKRCRTIDGLKTLIEGVMHVHIKELHLEDGKILDIHSSLSDYDIKENTMVVIAMEKLTKLELAEHQDSNSD